MGSFPGFIPLFRPAAGAGGDKGVWGQGRALVQRPPRWHIPVPAPKSQCQHPNPSAATHIPVPEPTSRCQDPHPAGICERSSRSRGPRGLRGRRWVPLVQAGALFPKGCHGYRSPWRRDALPTRCRFRPCPEHPPRAWGTRLWGGDTPKHLPAHPRGSPRCAPHASNEQPLGRWHETAKIPQIPPK